MAVTSTKIHRDTSAEYSAGSTKRRLFITVFVDNENDGPDTVILGCGFSRGDFWSYGGESDPTCELQSLSPVRKTKTRWVVEAVFESLADTRKLDVELLEGGGQGPAGTGGVFNPDNLDSTVRVSHRAKNIVKWKGRFLGFVNADGNPLSLNNPYMQPGTDIQIMTSNTVPLNPAIEEQEYYPAFIVTTRTNAYINSSLIGKINDAATRILTTINGVTQFDKTFAEDTLLCVQEDYDPLIYQGVPWFTVTLELLYNANGWYTEFLDQGIMELKPVERQSGGGGTYFDPPELQRIIDSVGNPISDPVGLDGLGEKLDTNDVDAAVFLRYRTLNRTSYSSAYIPFI